MYKKKLYGYVIEMEYSNSYYDVDGSKHDNVFWRIHYSSKIYIDKKSGLEAVDAIKKVMTRRVRLKPLYEFIEEK